MSPRIVDLTYDVYLGGLHIFTFDVDMALQPDRYRVAAEGGTQGMVGWLYEWQTKLAAEGLDRNGRIEPQRYDVESNWQGNLRTVQLGFAEDGRYDLSGLRRRSPIPISKGSCRNRFRKGPSIRSVLPSPPAGRWSRTAAATRPCRCSTVSAATT